MEFGDGRDRILFIYGPFCFSLDIDGRPTSWPVLLDWPVGLALR
jgi:hypothetical protein